MVGLVRRSIQAAVLAGAAVQLAGLLQSVHPLFDSIAHFRLHLTVALAAGVAVLLLVRSWRVAAAALAVAGAGIIGMAPVMGSVGPDVDADTRRLVIVQFNMLFKNQTPEALAGQVRAANADAIMLEEVSTRNRALMAVLASDYPSQHFCPSYRVGGVAVVSRWPTLAVGCEGKGIAWLRADVNGTPVTFTALHLHWPFPYEQADQITALESALQGLPQPVVLAGDFNAAPWSHSVARIAEATRTTLAGGLRMTLEMSFLGFRPLPVLPIDHVLLPASARAVDLRVGANAGSDHLPVIATFDLRR